ncbi:HAD family hydrolase, partial [Facilibium subflavum]
TFISQEVGLKKPDLDFFKLPLKKHNIIAKDTFFIGDSYYLDYLPSNNLGMLSILLDENNMFSPTLDINRINNINDCKRIILD